MSAFLVTGNPGSGKSTVAAELARRGLAAIDPDYDPDLSCWEDEAGNKVSLADGPTDPDQAWLRSHRWVWSRSRLVHLLAHDDAPVFVCGIALNIDQMADLFDAVFLLRIDAATQEARLAAHDALHPPGRSEAGRQEIRAGRPIFEGQMRGLGAIVLDGAAPAVSIADELLAVINRRQ